MIYFARSYNEFIKIGTTANVTERIKGLQTGSPRKLHVQAIMDGSFQTEKGLHELFGKSRVRDTEWFKYTEELKWFIRAVKANPEDNNILSLYRISQQMRLKYKAKRLGPKNKLHQRLEIYGEV